MMDWLKLCGIHKMRPKHRATHTKHSSIHDHSHRFMHIKAPILHHRYLCLSRTKNFISAFSCIQAQYAYAVSSSEPQQPISLLFCISVITHVILSFIFSVLVHPVSAYSFGHALIKCLLSIEYWILTIFSSFRVSKTKSANTFREKNWHFPSSGYGDAVIRFGATTVFMALYVIHKMHIKNFLCSHFFRVPGAAEIVFFLPFSLWFCSTPWIAALWDAIQRFDSFLIYYRFKNLMNHCPKIVWRRREKKR